MRYWDSSALVPLMLLEPTTPMVRGWLGSDPDVATWALTRVELASAIERRTREGSLDAAGRTLALGNVRTFAGQAHEVADLAGVRTRAMQALGRYPLRAADALQLGAALSIAEPDPSTWTFVVLDRRLADAAAREGFQVLTAP